MNASKKILIKISEAINLNENEILSIISKLQSVLKKVIPQYVKNIKYFDGSHAYRADGSSYAFGGFVELGPKMCFVEVPEAWQYYDAMKIWKKLDTAAAKIDWCVGKIPDNVGTPGFYFYPKGYDK